ncbi:MAG: HAD-IB family hydrolase [Gammaproteobacteria bacterium]|nr:HAD-IB family hydrolase [Gammaproteobacteria bacterium]MCI0590347.1 HAD-IB family hydrolase [Gammaproteobacteria bacterium]
MSLALFDLDNTLIGGDSDLLWGQYLAEHGYVDAPSHEREHKRFYDEYLAGTVDIHAFLRFQLRELAENPFETVNRWRSNFIREKIEPIVLPKAQRLLDEHRAQGHILVIITATNRFITEPIAKVFGVRHLIASEPEMINGQYTGRILGTPPFAEGKVTCLNEWLEHQGLDFADSWFYSDSHNDLPLLKRVTHPVAVDPDDSLAAEALKRGWMTISLR